jgi:hypothetical protein
MREEIEQAKERERPTHRSQGQLHVPSELSSGKRYTHGR